MVVVNRTLKKYTSLNNMEHHSNIVHPTVDANNFKLNSSMMQQNQFSNSLTYDSNLHLSIFVEYCDTLKMNRVTNNTI